MPLLGMFWHAHASTRTRGKPSAQCSFVPSMLQAVPVQVVIACSGARKARVGRYAHQLNSLLVDVGVELDVRGRLASACCGVPLSVPGYAVPSHLQGSHTFQHVSRDCRPFGALTYMLTSTPVCNHPTYICLAVCLHSLAPLSVHLSGWPTTELQTGRGLSGHSCHSCPVPLCTVCHQVSETHALNGM